MASAFRLTGPELTGWPGYDCFFNACLLRRPARVVWVDVLSKERRFRWAVSDANLPRPDAANVTLDSPSAAKQLQEAFAIVLLDRDQQTANTPLDAAKMTAVRYFARDAGVAFKDYAGIMPPRGLNGLNGNDASIDADEDAPTPDKAAPGLGAWNDYGPVAQAARTALSNAARITVPDRSFIIWVVAGYLCVLVPANWIVFRLLGRIEWAWIAAPLIAIVCTLVVIHQAQLNIGFARSRNEIAVIEMQPGYSRVHVARYTVLYTSLATRYEFRLDDPGGQILPFRMSLSPPGENDQNKRSLWQTGGELVCRRGDDTQLSGFSVGSNMVDFVHSEEMADFGGTLTLHHAGDGYRLTNGTPHPLEDCRAVCAGVRPGADRPA